MWGNISEIVTALATTGLVAAAYGQLRGIKVQEQRRATLSACDRYDFEPVLADSKKLIRDHLNKGLAVDDEDLRAAVVNLLNYLESISIGMKQGLYIEEIVKEHLGQIISLRLSELKKSNNPVIKECVDDMSVYFCELDKYHKKWSSAPASTAS